MGKSKIGLQFKGWEEQIARLDKIGGSSAMKQGVEEALKKSKEYVNPQIEKAMHNLPAHGKYSRPHTVNTINNDNTVIWEGMKGSIGVGFDFKESGPVSIFLMYGTPRMSPAKGLYAAIYGNKTKKAIQEIQAEAVQKEISKIMSRG